MLKLLLLSPFFPIALLTQTVVIYVKTWDLSATHVGHDLIVGLEPLQTIYDCIVEALAIDRTNLAVIVLSVNVKEDLGVVYVIRVVAKDWRPVKEAWESIYHGLDQAWIGKFADKELKVDHVFFCSVGEEIGIHILGV